MGFSPTHHRFSQGDVKCLSVLTISTIAHNVQNEAALRLYYHSAISPALGFCILTTLSQLSRHKGSKACFICTKELG